MALPLETILQPSLMMNSRIAMHSNQNFGSHAFNRVMEVGRIFFKGLLSDGALQEHLFHIGHEPGNIPVTRISATLTTSVQSTG